MGKIAADRLKRYNCASKHLGDFLGKGVKLAHRLKIKTFASDDANCSASEVLTRGIPKRGTHGLFGTMLIAVFLATML